MTITRSWHSDHAARPTGAEWTRHSPQVSCGPVPRAATKSPRCSCLVETALVGATAREERVVQPPRLPRCCRRRPTRRAGCSPRASPPGGLRVHLERCRADDRGPPAPPPPAPGGASPLWPSTCWRELSPSARRFSTCCRGRSGGWHPRPALARSIATSKASRSGFVAHRSLSAGVSRKLAVDSPRRITIPGRRVEQRPDLGRAEHRKSPAPRHA